MDRMASANAPIQNDNATRLFQRTLAHWAGDLLRHQPTIEWPAPSPDSDYRDRNWRNLYAGNVLDD